MISQGARTMTVGQSSFSADASGGRSSVARNSGLRGAKLRPARLYETAVRGERRPRILQSLSRLVESPAYAPRPQSGLGGWAQGRASLAGGSKVGRQVEQLRLFESRESPPPRAGLGAARHPKIGACFVKHRWRRPARGLGQVRVAAGDGQGGDNPLGCVLCLLSVASQKVGAPAA
jgi:hypothetical protein